MKIDNYKSNAKGMLIEGEILQILLRLLSEILRGRSD